MSKGEKRGGRKKATEAKVPGSTFGTFEGTTKKIAERGGDVLWSWNSRKPRRMISPTPIHTRFLNLPRMWHRRLTPSKQKASRRPLPSMRVTWAYSANLERVCKARRVEFRAGHGGRTREPTGVRHCCWVERVNGQPCNTALAGALTLPVLLEGELTLHITIGLSTPTVLSSL